MLKSTSPLLSVSVFGFDGVTGASAVFFAGVAHENTNNNKIIDGQIRLMILELSWVKFSNKMRVAG
jgi:hypothetical protein